VLGQGGGGPDDQLMRALMQKLLRSGPWSADERVNWLKLLAMAFQIAYGPQEAIEIKKEAAN
jgi:truncated hemoglobin YjbI